MTLVLKNKGEVNKYLQEYARRYETAMIYALSYLVTDLENHAKLSAGYNDQTSNLKSSIGGMVLKNGKIITTKGFQGKPAGTAVGVDYINSLIAQNNTGYAMILVAGMDYASFVENYHNLNVLKKSELRMNAELPKMLELLKSKLK